MTPPAQVLPPAGVAILQQAAQTPNTEQDPKAKLKAVEAAIERVKTLYPHYFIKEQLS